MTSLPKNSFPDSRCEKSAQCWNPGQVRASRRAEQNEIGSVRLKGSTWWVWRKGKYHPSFYICPLVLLDITEVSSTTASLLLRLFSAPLRVYAAVLLLVLWGISGSMKNAGFLRKKSRVQREISPWFQLAAARKENETLKGELRAGTRDSVEDGRAFFNMVPEGGKWHFEAFSCLFVSQLRAAPSQFTRKHFGFIFLAY